MRVEPGRLDLSTPAEAGQTISLRRIDETTLLNETTGWVGTGREAGFTAEQPLEHSLALSPEPMSNVPLHGIGSRYPIQKCSYHPAGLEKAAQQPAGWLY